jgi:hypothetical protein
MTARPVYFQPLELPAQCSLWEAVMWVSFGRFPSGAGYDTTEEMMSEVGLLSFAWKDSSGGPAYKFDGYWWFESDMAGISPDSVDWDRYSRAIHGGYVRRAWLEELLRRHKEAPPSEPMTEKDLTDDTGRPRDLVDLVIRHNRDEFYRLHLEKQLEELPFVDSTHQLYQRNIDRGWSRLFQHLVEGSVVAYGWADLTQDEIRHEAQSRLLTDYQVSIEAGNVINPWHNALPQADLVGPLLQMGKFQAVPTTEWSLSGLAPDGHYVTTEGRQIWDVLIACDDLMRLFPRPIPTLGNRLEIDLVTPGLAISVDRDDRSAPQPRLDRRDGASARGRRKKANGEIEKACQALYSRRLVAGEKETALAEEAAQFAMAVWGEKLSRSTFQDYMLPFKRQAPEIAPEIAAE